MVLLRQAAISCRTLLAAQCKEMGVLRQGNWCESAAYCLSKELNSSVSLTQVHGKLYLILFIILSLQIFGYVRFIELVLLEGNTIYLIGLIFPIFLTKIALKQSYKHCKASVCSCTTYPLMQDDDPVKGFSGNVFQFPLFNSKHFLLTAANLKCTKNIKFQKENEVNDD